jgi:hypothetical protein
MIPSVTQLASFVMERQQRSLIVVTFNEEFTEEEDVFMGKIHE